MKIGKRLWVFHPECEMAIANGSPYYMPPARIVRMGEDLAFLPAYLAEKGDGVLVKELPDDEFMASVYRKLDLSICCVRETELGTEGGWVPKPWGWSPKMCHWFSLRGMGEEWKPEQKEWYSRKVARNGLARLLEWNSELNPMMLPELCYSIDDVEQKMKDGDYLAKAPWSSSGKGILTLKKPLVVKEKEWLSGILKSQGYLMLERKWNKVRDFAMEFRKTAETVEFIGWSLFTTGGHGEYRGNYLGRQSVMEERLAEEIGRTRIEWMKCQLPVMLAALLPAYEGYLGVDMMVYADESGKYALHPCVEINLRYNMGIVALYLSRRYLGESTEGEFSIHYYAGAGEARKEQHRLLQACPVVYKNNRIQSGYLNLTPVTEATHFVASVRCY